MIFLELAMLAIGIAAVVYSYRKVKEEAAATPPLDEESQALLKKLDRKSTRLNSSHMA